jgi:leader peptidase (prepilin peptidase)/N-methyltransferase
VSGLEILLVESHGLIWVVAAFGLFVGSFLNVVIHRLPREESIAWDRSRCPECGAGIPWYHNVPVVAWLWLLGKCCKCRKPISVRYPLVELLTGALFGAVTWNHLRFDPDILSLAGGASLVVHLVFVSALVAGTFIDFDFRILPDRITLPGMAVAPILCTLLPSLQGEKDPQAGLFASVLGVVTGAGTIFLIGFLGKLLFRKDAMGLGDVKFLGMIGGILGAELVLLSLVAASIFGSIFGVAWLLIKKDHYIPFGPFLALGALTMLLFGVEIDTFLRVTYPAWVSGLLG